MTCQAPAVGHPGKTLWTARLMDRASRAHGFESWGLLWRLGKAGSGGSTRLYVLRLRRRGGIDDVELGVLDQIRFREVGREAEVTGAGRPSRPDPRQEVVDCGVGLLALVVVARLRREKEIVGASDDGLWRVFLSRGEGLGTGIVLWRDLVEVVSPLLRLIERGVVRCFLLGLWRGLWRASGCSSRVSSAAQNVASGARGWPSGSSSSGASGFGRAEASASARGGASGGGSETSPSPLSSKEAKLAWRSSSCASGAKTSSAEARASGASAGGGVATGASGAVPTAVRPSYEALMVARSPGSAPKRSPRSVRRTMPTPSRGTSPLMAMSASSCSTLCRSAPRP